MLHFCIGVGAQAELLHDHFDDGVLNPNWSIGLNQNVAGWSYTESGTNLRVDDIAATSTSDDAIQYPRATVTLRQPISPLAPGLVQIPDVSFISWDRLPGRKVPRTPIADLAPDLAVEVISKSNTPQEMSRKLADYFATGVRQVWYVYHSPRREVQVYTAADEHVVLGEDQQLDGGRLLPGFSLPLQSFFADPGQTPTS